MSFRRGDLCGPFRVICQQQQAFTGFVEAAHGAYPWGIFFQVRIHGLSSLLIRSCGHNAATLIHHEIDQRAGLDGNSVDLDPIPANMDWRLRISREISIQANMAAANQPECFGARTVSELRKSARQPDSPRWMSHFHGTILTN